MRGVVALDEESVFSLYKGFRDTGVLKQRKRKMALTFCHLRAEDPAKNLYREYSFYLTQDLFGEWLLITQWGRKGYKKQEKRYVFADEVSAQEKIDQILKKRLNSQKRIGCNYKIIG